MHNINAHVNNKILLIFLRCSCFFWHLGCWRLTAANEPWILGCTCCTLGICGLQEVGITLASVMSLYVIWKYDAWGTQSHTDWLATGLYNLSCTVRSTNAHGLTPSQLQLISERKKMVLFEQDLVYTKWMLLGRNWSGCLRKRLLSCPKEEF